MQSLKLQNGVSLHLKETPLNQNIFALSKIECKSTHFISTNQIQFQHITFVISDIYISALKV